MEELLLYDERQFLAGKTDVDFGRYGAFAVYFLHRASRSVYADLAQRRFMDIVSAVFLSKCIKRGYRRKSFFLA